MKYFLGLLFFLTQAGAFADYESFINYRDPVDGESLQGWYGPMADLKDQLDPDKNYAVAILHNPINAFLFQDIRWFRSTVVAVRKELRGNHAGKLGHFQVAWSCKVGGESRQYGMTGQTGELSGQGVRMLTELGYGMSLFFANFTDGYLQSAKASGHRIPGSTETYGFNWVAFEISESDCEQGLYYMDQYIESMAYQNFSFIKDPNQLEGGGCTSFASELLFQFGAWKSKLLKAWQTEFGIPKNTLKNPRASALPANTQLPAFLSEKPYTNKSVNIFSMILRADFHLKKNQVKAKIYDTELIIHTLRSMVARAYSEKPKSFPRNYVMKPRKAYGLVHHKTNPNLLQSGASKHYVLVDQGLDFSFKRLSDYIFHPDIRLPEFSYQELDTVPGVVFERAVW